MFTLTFNLKGLTCDACVRLIKKRLMRIPGVQDVVSDMAGVTTLTASQEITRENIADFLAGTPYILV